VIVDVEATAPIRQAEAGGAMDMIVRTRDRFGLYPEKLVADTAYGSAETPTGFWTSDAAFFATGGTGNWKGNLTEADLAAYHARLTDLIPDAAGRCLEEGGGPAC
jgi:hypothetical protein